MLKSITHIGIVSYSGQKETIANFLVTGAQNFNFVPIFFC